MRELLAGAQAAEARGEKSEAIALLRKAAEIYRDSKNATRALKMLRHIRRLEGIDERDDVGDVLPGSSLRLSLRSEEPAPRAPRACSKSGAR